MAGAQAGAQAGAAAAEAADGAEATHATPDAHAQAAAARLPPVVGRRELYRFSYEALIDSVLELQERLYDAANVPMPPVASAVEQSGRSVGSVGSISSSGGFGGFRGASGLRQLLLPSEHAHFAVGAPLGFLPGAAPDSNHLVSSHHSERSSAPCTPVQASQRALARASASPPPSSADSFAAAAHDPWIGRARCTGGTATEAGAACAPRSASGSAQKSRAVDAAHEV